MTTIIATVGGASSNSYVTLAEADAYWADQFYSTTWDALVDDDKNKLLTMATRLLDDWVDWAGYKVDDSQALRWPRYDVADRDGFWIESDILPIFLKNAVYELANYLASGDPTAEPDTKGFSELKVGELELVVDKSDRDAITVLPDSVIAIIEYYGTVRTRGASGNIDLVRV